MTKAQGKSKSQAPTESVSFDWAEALLREDGATYGVRKYDLAERTAKFGEAIIHLAKKVRPNAVTTPLINQLVRCGTSIGANYCEADDAVSKKEFRNKIGTCRKEAKETKYFLRMLAGADDSIRNDARLLWKEARELHLIFCAIFKK